MRSTRTFIAVAVCTLMLGACGDSAPASRNSLRIVGSSTVYPFATAVAEKFARDGHNPPAIESTGTDGGMQLFCAGVGAPYPDIEDASRRMKQADYEVCRKNGVTDIIEVQVGIDGVILAEDKQGAGMKLALVDVYKALAANPFGKPNSARTWKDVNPSLPDEPILVYGPPSTSGTRDALKSLILQAGCNTDPAMKALKKADKTRYTAICQEIRRDGPYVDAGENDNLVVQKLAKNYNAIGIFGYSYLEQNAAALNGISLSGVKPTYDAIADFSYPGARPLYIYVKKQHLVLTSDLEAYVAEWAKAWGPDGYLKPKGLIVAKEDVRRKNADIIAHMTPLDPAVLE